MGTDAGKTSFVWRNKYFPSNVRYHTTFIAQFALMLFSFHFHVSMTVLFHSDSFHFESIIVEKQVSKIVYFNLNRCREGDISLLEVDAITNTTDETLTEKNIISRKVFRRAGSYLQEEIANNNRGNQRLRRRFIWCLSCADIDLVRFLFILRMQNWWCSCHERL